MSSTNPLNTLHNYVNVFDPEGVLAGSFELPADLEVLDVGDDYLLGLYSAFRARTGSTRLALLAGM